MATNGIRSTQLFTMVDSDGDGSLDTLRVETVDASATTATTSESSSDSTSVDETSTRRSTQDLTTTNSGLTVEGEDTSDVVRTLDQPQRDTLTSIASALTDGTNSSASLQGRWADFVASLKVNGTQDINALVQQVLRESYLETNKDLEFYAEKVSFYNQLKKEIRSDISDLRQILAENAGKEDDESIGSLADLAAYTDDDGNTILDVTTDEDGNEYISELYPHSGTPGLDEEGNMVSVREETAGLSENEDGEITKEQLSSYIDELEENLNSVGDDAQLANVDLQNVLQKQQQTLQMLSNISKMLYDTAIAVCRKIGG